MRLLLPILFAASVSACAQIPAQAPHQPTVWTPEQKRQIIMKGLDYHARNMDGIRLNSRWHGESAGDLNQYTLLDLGKYYAAGKHMPANIDLAEKYFAAAFERDSGLGGSIGNFYYDELKDYPKALRWYENSIRAGDALSLAWLAIKFRDKTPGFYDPEKLAALSRIAIANGHGFAHNFLGDHYFEGKGVEINHVKALRHYLAAYKYNPKSARLARIGAIYLRGQGVDKNPAEAVKWYRRAVRNGRYWNAVWLAERYRDGTLGKDLHLSHAFSWYLVAAALGDPGGLEMARDLFPRLTMKTINRAMRLAQNFFDESLPK